MTHGHIDHVGCGKWLRDNYHVVTYLSETDDKLRLAQPKEDNRPEGWKEFEIDRYLCDGDVIDCGKKFINVAMNCHADVALTNHTAFDNGQERIAYSRFG